MSPRGSESPLTERLDEVAATLQGIDRGGEGTAVAYRVGGALFAVVEGGRASFRLKPDIAAAALRTPGARPSDRGQGWVDLEPETLDSFALDRAAAWFESAARHARVA